MKVTSSDKGDYAVMAFCLVGLSVCIAALATGTGCTPAQQTSANNAATQINNGLQNNPSAVQNALLNGLNKLALAHPGDAKDLAVSVSAASQLAAASFSGNALPTGPAAQTIINSLFTKAPASAAGLVTTVSGMIQLAVTIPSGSDHVSPQVAALIVTISNDLNAACSTFLNQPANPPTVAPAPVMAPASTGGASDAEIKTERDYFKVTIF